jgi:hypothetical protein
MSIIIDSQGELRKACLDRLGKALRKENKEREFKRKTAIAGSGGTTNSCLGT